MSTVSTLLSQGVLRIKPAVRAASRDHADEVGASLLSVSNTLNGVEPHTSAALVRERAAVLTPRIEPLDGKRAPWLPGYRVNMIAGNGSEASARRLNAWREVQGGALPGQSLVVSEPAHGLVRDVLPWEDGPAHARSLLGQGLETVQAGDLWMPDRPGCPWALLCASDTRGAGCLPRQYEGRPLETVQVWRAMGRMETGHVAEQRVHVRDAQGGPHRCRRIRVKLDQATRDGDRVLSLLTTLPLRRASATRVARC